MTETEEKMYRIIEKIFEGDLKQLETEIPAEGVKTRYELLDTGYNGDIRIAACPLTPGEYSLWVDVYQTPFDPKYSNSLMKGTKDQVKQWLEDPGHIKQVYSCMKHLHDLAEEGL